MKAFLMKIFYVLMSFFRKLVHAYVCDNEHKEKKEGQEDDSESAGLSSQQRERADEQDERGSD